MKTISLDLRQRILAAYDKGGSSRQQIADRFLVSLGMVKKLLQQRRHTGDIGPQHHRAGRHRKIAKADEPRLLALVRAQPDATLEELHERLAIECHVTTVHRSLRRLRQRYKKKT